MVGSSGSYWKARHWFFVSFLTLSTLSSTATFYHLLSHNGTTFAEIFFLSVYLCLQTWIGANFLISLFGVLAMAGTATDPLRQPRRPLVARPGRSPRVAVVMPIYNEEVARTFAGIQAIYRSLQDSGALRQFHFFVLSDSRKEEAAAAEERAWCESCRLLKAEGRLFYRRRPENVGRKTGNIADFCRRWGRRYEYMVVLDADSIMSGQAMAAMVGAMDRNPRLALLQLWSRPVNGRSLFARLQQFAASVYGRLVAAGISYLQLGAANYWGHNAIVRIRPFMESCGLPTLPGRAPLGGEILSHDFVEAALLIRAGWEVRLSYAPLESFEDSPPTLVDHLKRDRRWCQGNLQHGWLLLARGLHPMSRLNFLFGIMAYASSLLWLAFLVLAVIVALQGGVPAGGSAGDQALYAVLLAFSTLLLLGPKLLGLAVTLAGRETRRAHGGTARLLAGTGLEILCSALLAPLMMLRHCAFVLTVLLGRAVGWDPQVRDAQRLGLRDALVTLRLETAAGIALCGFTLLVDPVLFFWLAPLAVGLVVSAPLLVLTADVRVGGFTRRTGLLRIPEETKPPKVLALLPLYRAALERRMVPSLPIRAGWPVEPFYDSRPAAGLNGIAAREIGS